MATEVVGTPCEGGAERFWKGLAVAFRSATHAAHEARVFRTMAMDTVEDCAMNAAQRIRRHPLAAVGAAFAIGVPAGLLVGWIAGHRRVEPQH